jgi:hypothetical protein
MNTIINPDAQTYAGPRLPPQPPPVFPLWMYSPVLPPVIAVNLAQLNAFTAQGFSAAYQPPYPVPNSPPATVAATVPSGITDNYAPRGYIAGSTSRLVLVPAAATSKLAGLVAANDGWTIEIFNSSSLPNGNNPGNAQPLTILNGASATPGNSFILPNAANAVIPSQGGAFFQWVAAVNGWMAL